MRHPDSAQFIYSMTKRARKYFLGITTITQDVEDFIHNSFGKAIVSNSSVQFLMKQSTSSVPALAETFYLSEGERQLLVTADVGGGIFFAGQNHVALRVVASPEEHRVITSDPEELMARRSRQQRVQQAQAEQAGGQKYGPEASSSVSQFNQGPAAGSQPAAESGLDRAQPEAQSAVQGEVGRPPDAGVPVDEKTQRKGQHSIDDYEQPNG